ncbi:MAG TPA: hypothetical protein VF803_01045 [Candidatus Paceibacterota bacterium]
MDSLYSASLTEAQLKDFVRLFDELHVSQVCAVVFSGDPNTKGSTIVTIRPINQMATDLLGRSFKDGMLHHCGWRKYFAKTAAAEDAAL